MNNSISSANINNQELIIDGASCASCVSKIEKALNNIPGVEKAEMNFALRTVSVTGVVKQDILISTVESIGYHAKSANEASDEELLDEKEIAEQKYYKKLMLQMWVGLGLGMPLMIYSLLGGPMTVNSNFERAIWLIIGLVCAAVMYFAGKHFYIGAYKSFVNHSANMDTLIALGTGTAWFYSMVVVLFPLALPEMARHVYFEASAMIIGLINLGLALEVKARGRTSEAIKRLIGLQAKTARIVREGQELDIAIEQVLLDDAVRVRPGERVPVDGVVIEGSTTIDESMLTGEPMPVKKGEGDEVVAGTINKAGSIIFNATRVGKDTALARIINMVKQAQNSKPPIGRLADIISAYFVPVIMIIAISSALIWLNFGPDPTIAFAVVSATTVLIIACPCALGLATPMSVMVGVGKAAEAGVLIRNGEALQTSSQITAMVLDKTGTITLGEPKVTDIIAIEHDNAYDESVTLSLAASLEVGSEHPLAQAIVDSAKDKNLAIDKVTDFHAIAGQGVQGSVNGESLFFGNEKLMHEQGISLTKAAIDCAQQMASEAKTPMYFAINNELAAIIAVSDPIKEDSASAIKRLQDNGIRVVMLTGDNQATAKAVAEKVGITEFFAEVLPEDKASKVAELQASGEIVGMTGDGINDAPALALANVGFAIGTGTDVAIESADITLMRGSLHGLADAIAVSKATLRNIKQNLFGAFIYNVAGVPFAAGILYPFFGLLLSPVIAGAAMAFSSLTVVTNANRLRFFKPQDH
ncbi:MAG: copper-translocating P-type ATPase [Gammaproteobacteria bacterium]|nr:MAG: copper-translocating P-type ATPase [Gammaproteobacteria bacterium]